MRHRHVGAGGERALDAGQRVIDQAQQFARRLFVGFEAGGGGAADAVAQGIGQADRESSIKL
jgi:hypothetical protein